MKRSSLKRVAGIVLLTACGVCMAWMTIEDVRSFMVEDKGVEFYRSHPHLVAVCLAIGVGVGLAAHVILGRKGRKKTASGASPDTGGD